RRRWIEAEPLVGLGGCVWIHRVEGDVIEGVLGVGRRLDEGQVQALAEIEIPVALGQLPDAERYVLECALLARAPGVEEGPLSAARVGADEGEVVLLVDDVEGQFRRDDFRDRPAVGQPEGDVVKGLGRHAQDPSYHLLPYVDRAPKLGLAHARPPWNVPGLGLVVELFLRAALGPARA